MEAYPRPCSPAAHTLSKAIPPIRLLPIVWVSILEVTQLMSPKLYGILLQVMVLHSEVFESKLHDNVQTFWGEIEPIIDDYEKCLITSTCFASTLIDPPAVDKTRKFVNGRARIMNWGRRQLATKGLRASKRLKGGTQMQQ